MIGRTVAHYRITDRLGAGGMGEVYLATDTRLDRQVALKFLPESLQRDPEARERLLREAKAASKLNHPNILTVYAIEETDGRDFIVMEYIAGSSIADFIAAAEQPIDQVLAYAIQLCEGLEKAHRAGIVHRDLKPDNILIDTDGRPKICDFGLAQLKGAAKLTKDHSTLGTAHYMSPEQARGDTVDHRSDIWSLGAILHEMLTGQPPFPGDYDQAVIYAVLNERPRPVAEARPDVPQRIADLVEKALQKDPAERYQTAEELRAELETVRRELRSKAAATTAGTAERHPSIAVLPFANLSADPENEYFSDGLSEELINALSKIRSLQVPARTSSFSFKGKDADVREIGKKLGVATVLEGSVRKAGNRLRITAQLVNVADGYHLWSERYDRDMDDIFAIQDEISLIIVDKLKGSLLREEEEALVKHSTDDADAYNHYLKGLYHLNRRTEADFAKALEHFRAAIKCDPECADCYAGVANTLALGGSLGYDFYPPHECYPEAERYALRALEIDPELPEALNGLALVNLGYKWDWDTAGKLLARSLSLNPNLPNTHHFQAEYLTVVGRTEDALAAEKHAQKLDPLSLVIGASVGRRYYYTRDYERAVAEVRHTLDMDPGFLVSHLVLIECLLQMERYEEALAIGRNAPVPDRPPTFYLMIMGALHARMGNHDEARAIISRLQERATQQYVPPMAFAFVCFALDETDTAFDWLEKAYAGRDGYLIGMKSDPATDPVRDDPRYHSLLKKMGLDQ